VRPPPSLFNGTCHRAARLANPIAIQSRLSAMGCKSFDAASHERLSPTSDAGVDSVGSDTCSRRDVGLFLFLSSFAAANNSGRWLCTAGCFGDAAQCPFQQASFPNPSAFPFSSPENGGLTGLPHAERDCEVQLLLLDTLIHWHWDRLPSSHGGTRPWYWDLPCLSSS
jgi:hypothetical protein